MNQNPSTMPMIEIMDTTLRDGEQTNGVSYTAVMKSASRRSSAMAAASSLERTTLIATSRAGRCWR